MCCISQEHVWDASHYLVRLVFSGLKEMFTGTREIQVGSLHLHEVKYIQCSHPPITTSINSYLKVTNSITGQTFLKNIVIIINCLQKLVVKIAHKK